MKPELKKPMKIVAVLLLVMASGLVGFYVAAGILIKPETYQQQIISEIKTRTGLEAKITGNARIALVPTPKLIISDMKLGGGEAPDFSIKTIEIYIAPLSILSGAAQISEVVVQQPTLSLARSKDEAINWQWLNGDLLKSLDTKSWSEALPITIKNGVIEYLYSPDENPLLLTGIAGNGIFGSQLNINGSGRIGERQISFSVSNRGDGMALDVNEFPLNINVVANNKNYLKLQTAVASGKKGVKISGKLSAEADDVEQWLPAPPQRTNNVEKTKVEKQKQNSAAKQPPLPLALSGDFMLENGILHLKNMTIDGLNSKGEGFADVSWQHWYPAIAAELNFVTLDYTMWKQLLSNRIGEIYVDKKIKAEGVRNYDFRKANPIPQNIEIAVKVAADKVVDGKQVWGKTNLNAAVEGGVLTVNQCDIDLAGGGLFSLFGVLSQSGIGELHFQGNVEARGHSLKQTIAMFNAEASDLPALGLGEFNATGNLYIAPNQINFSEAKVKLENIDLTGEIISNLGDDTRIQAKIKIKDLNFDAVRDSFRKKNASILTKATEIISGGKQKTTTDKSALAKSTFDSGFEWLKNLKTKIEAQVFADNFTFMERKGDKASFGVFAYDGVLKIIDGQLKYPAYNTNISFMLNMLGAQPAVTLTMNTDQIDTNYFDLSPSVSPSTNSGANSGAGTDINAKLPLELLDGFSGVFDISVRKFIHKAIILEKVKMQASLDAQQLAIQKLGFVYSKAQSEVTGTLFGGKIPGLSIRFTMANADLLDLMKSLTGISNVSGNANISGVISTSGHTLKEWLQIMDAKILLAGRAVRMDKLNIDGISNVVSVSRSSADVVNNVNNVLTKGATEFAVDGSINIKDGEMKTPFISLKTGLVDGNLVGGINLTSMKTQLSVIFSFANLLPSNPPTIIVQLSGALSSPEMKVDTSSLEAFVAKRSVK